MKTPKYKIHSLALGMILLAAAGCSNDMDTGGGEELPEGKYPLEFTSQMYGMNVTRATTDNTWSGGEEVAVKVDGTVRIYTAASLEGKLTAKTSQNDPFYWTKRTETKTVSAYYPYIYATANTITVQTDQSGSGYQSSDVLFAPATSIAFTDATKNLTFQHVPVKVVVNLKNGDGVSATEVQGATVTFVNQPSYAPFDPATGVVTPALPGISVLTPNTLPTPVSGYQKSVQALLIPCQMQGNQFIKVTIGNDSFYYTPTGATDANFTSGKVHTYVITVKRNGIDVKTTGSGYWTNGGNENIESSKRTVKAGDYYYSDGTYSAVLNINKTCIGVVFWVDGSGGGKIVSLDESSHIFWTHVLCDETSLNSIMGSIYDGKGATDYMLSTYGIDIIDYDSFNWIATKRTTSGNNRWYMPAKVELEDLNKVKTTVNYSLANASAKTLSSYYWATTETAYDCAWAVNLSWGISYNCTKYQEYQGYEYKVRAIAAF